MYPVRPHLPTSNLALLRLSAQWRKATNCSRCPATTAFYLRVHHLSASQPLVIKADADSRPFEWFEGGAFPSCHPYVPRSWKPTSTHRLNDPIWELHTRAAFNSSDSFASPPGLASTSFAACLTNVLPMGNGTFGSVGEGQRRSMLESFLTEEGMRYVYPTGMKQTVLRLSTPTWTRAVQLRKIEYTGSRKFLGSRQVPVPFRPTNGGRFRRLLLCRLWLLLWDPVENRGSWTMTDSGSFLASSITRAASSCIRSSGPFESDDSTIARSLSPDVISAEANGTFAWRGPGTWTNLLTASSTQLAFAHFSFVIDVVPAFFARGQQLARAAAGQCGREKQWPDPPILATRLQVHVYPNSANKGSFSYPRQLDQPLLHTIPL